jgi:hypothetical protein
MGNMERNRRRNQIIAERTASKIRKESPWRAWGDAKLWDAVLAALASAEHTQRWLGHTDKCAEAVIGREAACELRMRGTQTRLPI